MGIIFLKSTLREVSQISCVSQFGIPSILSHPKSSGGLVLIVIITVFIIAFIGNTKIREQLLIKIDSLGVK